MNLAPTDRWKAAIEGKALRHSADLHGGVARSLALLGTHGHDIAPSGGPSGTEWAYYAVRDLLEDTNADATGDTWASLSGLLPLLAEAAPDVFAHAVTAGLSGDDPVLSRISKTERKTTASRRTHRTPGCCGRSRISAGRPTTWVSQPSVSHASRSLTPAVGSPTDPLPAWRQSSRHGIPKTLRRRRDAWRSSTAFGPGIRRSLGSCCCRCCRNVMARTFQHAGLA